MSPKTVLLVENPVLFKSKLNLEFLKPPNALFTGLKIPDVNVFLQYIKPNALYD